MADSSLAVNGGNVDTRTEGTNSDHRQVVVIGDPATNAGVAPVDATNGLTVNVLGSALTALQLIDDPVATLGTATYTEGTTKGNVIGAVRRDADTTLVDTTNEIGPLQMDANGRLKVEVFSGETLPVSGTVTINAVPAGTNNIGDVDVLTVPADPFGANADAASVSTSISAKLKGIATALGITALDLGSGTGGSRTLRFFLDTAQWVGGAGNVTSATQRVTLPADDPAVAVLGTTAGAKVITDANGTIQQYLRGLVSQWVARTLTFASQGYAARVSVTRPSNATPYTGGDVVGVTGGGTASITFSNMGPAAGEITITSAFLAVHRSALISGETSYTLHLYNVTQPGAQTDNAVFDLAAGDRSAYLGSIALGIPVDLGATCRVDVQVNKQITLAGTSLFGVLVTDTGYTPTSAAVHEIGLNAVAV